MNIEDIMPPDWQSWNYTLSNFDPTILAIYEEVNRLFPGTWVNVKDGKRANNWCGLRSPSCAIGAKNSAHRQGRALDLHHACLKALRDWATSTEGLQAGIMRVECSMATPTWLHVDTMPPNEAGWRDKTRPYIFRP